MNSSKKAIRAMKKRLARKAANEAKKSLYKAGKPVLVEVSNTELVRRLFVEGFLKDYDYTKMSSIDILIYWYEGTSGADFYASREWLELRYKAFNKYGRVCLCCGAKPPDIVLHVDHIKPRSKFPLLELDINNVQILCEDCNIGKSNIDSTDFR